MATRTLIHLPPNIRRGDIVEVRTTIAHVMETGFRVDSEGRTVPRDIITHFEARLDTTPVIAFDLFAAIAAQPYLAFTLKADRSGVLHLLWEGDRGFRHVEQVALTVS